MWKEPCKGSEIEYENISLHAVGGRLNKPDFVPVEEWAGDLWVMAWLRLYESKPQQKRVLRAFVIIHRPEPKWSNYDQDEAKVILCGGPNSLMLKNQGMSCG